MSKREIQLDVITPSGPIFSSPVEFLSIMGPEGSIGVLPGHVPVFMKIDVGFVEYQRSGERDFITTMGGILEFHHNHATILTESAEHAADIDEFRAKDSLKRAESSMMEKAGEKALSTADSLAALQRAATRLRVVELLKNRQTRRRI
ncbi:ATP synthase F1 subunit epsilon [bacterium (Candidatus Blackallbacteria) CG17_big_fil_post_rev_8_21_14_2_50_48_46]|uniref:ATP synthase epsilon chain n=1 Tax=bacterium (Candidatus Blackallbacteria) CG17_big_fil_post_rev_8_21_14_2_50_48_46 TaxID=2014261 RepID=A0A2M7G323_9BACT|nr:MAG: ATP synthase F1 subunit epsilon [bacterium (Candidatus Blackallbacteria) CG18_big_fil_WC_8_21_14_2_50_49_26]PIW16221.1 MAG: ATP synthase F1 subunit epsilon [bacterium (Candidatus Blackallbacteria) CG17_big_fil_post_rev_8_21_14_2_50_48_46]PIW49896.1 MAG: ATP synthase F1 subunit epsilon [bacterium (Candidatus Blackallbacteria) CG13_big_fil_rev_8_21_14_2_50_49_14]